jgi:ABC-type amino acid transport substrate-binding protein
MNPGFPILRKSGFPLVVGLIVMFFVTQAAAGGLEDARRRGKLLAGVKTDFPPFGYVDSTGGYQGFDVEIARYLGHALLPGEQGTELVSVTSGSRIPFLYSGWIDLIVATMTITDDRRKVLDFSEPYFSSGSLILVRKDSPVKGLDDLAGKNVAVIEGAVHEKDLEELTPQAKLVKFGKIPEAIQALKNQQVDAFCQDDVVVQAIAKENTELQAAGKPFHVRSYAIAVRKGDLELVRWINEQLSRMKSDGAYEKLLRKFFGEGDGGPAKP